MIGEESRTALNARGSMYGGAELARGERVKPPKVGGGFCFAVRRVDSANRGENLRGGAGRGVDVG